MDATDQIYSEITQIIEQYRTEVPGRRRAWPKAVKERVQDLRRRKVSWDEISKSTGIPVSTLYQWRIRKSTSSFQELSVVPTSGRSRSDGHSVTVVVSDRIRVEGLDVGSVIKLIQRLDR